LTFSYIVGSGGDKKPKAATANSSDATAVAKPVTTSITLFAGNFREHLRCELISLLAKCGGRKTILNHIKISKENMALAVTPLWPDLYVDYLAV
jgi:hypothetical protein